MFRDERTFCLYKIKGLDNEPKHEQWIGKKGYILGIVLAGTKLDFLIANTNELLTTSTIIDFELTPNGYIIETENSIYYFEEVENGV